MGTLSEASRDQAILEQAEKDGYAQIAATSDLNEAKSVARRRLPRWADERVIAVYTPRKSDLS